MSDVTTTPLSRFFGRLSRRFPSERITELHALNAATVDTAPLLEANRQFVFLHLRDLAGRHGLHVAPAVSVDSILTIRAGLSGGSDATERAMQHMRVDFLLMDGAARPVLAIDCVCPNVSPDNLKSRIFEKARLPLLDLAGGDALEADMTLIETTLLALPGVCGASRAN
ncbi:DUF2726 domain-containing protein [Jannaschia pohangensis]|uniref:DUF2726 domain-containing protein n=1 Tax=Jannaschia pohangensis TaxID=390807 RepID=A0A1I3JJ40_9RHOB|nr:DUF2726 domain-containing protein [Jannaschia pohangensis]SFI60194.1 Protein of unknown function [Jannaschia pohangensis]